jgi:damage-control phosphatase, subfamily III
VVELSLAVFRVLPLQVLAEPLQYASTNLVRRMHTYIRNSKHWKSYDVFARSKNTGFISSRTAVLELAAQYKKTITQLEQIQQGKVEHSAEESLKAEETLFIEMCEICLWGNKTDLSLLPNITHDQVQKLQGSKVRKAAEKNILVNDIPKAFKALSDARERSKGNIRVDIVLDNAGFELLTDMILAGYLLAAKLATNIILHSKTMPWFVSDVTPNDFGQLLNALQNAKSFFSEGSNGDPPLTEGESESLSFLFDHWTNLHVEGQLIVRPSDFWTEGGSYWRLPATAPHLHEDLKESQLIIFKGDLNYRKLTADVSMFPCMEQLS